MDTGRISDHNRNGLRAVRSAWRRDGLWDGVFAAVVVAMLFALTVWLSAVLAQSLDIERNAGNASAVFLPKSDDRDIEEEQPEPPLATGYRSEGSMPA